MATFEGRCTDAQGLCNAVVVARFNNLVSGKLLSGCLDCLHRQGIDVTPESSQLNVPWVQVSFELQDVAKNLVRRGRLRRPRFSEPR